MELNKSGLFLTALFVLALFGLAFLPNTGSAEGETLAIGGKVENFTLNDINGATQTFDKLKGEKGTIVVFLSARCPVVQNYNERIAKFAADNKSKGIAVIGLNSNHTEPLDEVKTHATEKYNFSMLIDKGNLIADKFGATVTPEFYLFNAEGKLVYRGRLDNDKSGANVTDNTLQTAVDETLAGKAVTKPEASASGCTIKRVK